jgi:PAS domain S-box-containing protein
MRIIKKSKSDEKSKTRQRRDYREQAFAALVSKFQNIRYLVEQKATIDVIEKTPVAICITNEKHLYEYVNPAYCKLYGYEFDELIGESFLIVVPEEFQTELVSLHDQFMNREYELEGNWEVVRKDGTRLQILANAAYVVDEQGRPKKVTFVLDVTEKMNAIEKVERLHRESHEIAEKLESVLRQIPTDGDAALRSELESIAHEIRGMSK